MVSFLISPLFTQWSSLVLGPGLRYPRDLPCGELRTAFGFSAAMAAFGARRNQDVGEVRDVFCCQSYGHENLPFWEDLNLAHLW
jgi:hypothetical protein